MSQKTKDSEVLIKYLDTLLSMFEVDRKINHEYNYTRDYDKSFQVFEFVKAELVEIRNYLLQD